MSEQYANDAVTTLASLCTSGATTISVSDASSFPLTGNFRIRIDMEILLVTGVSGTTFTVTRAAESVGGIQVASAHAAGAIVECVLTAASLAALGGGPVDTPLTPALGICTEIDPQIMNGNIKTAGPVDMTKFTRAFFIINVGAVVGGGALNLQLIEDTFSGLGSATNLAGSSTSLSGFNTANKIITWEIPAVLMTKRYLGLKITEVGSQNVYVCTVGFGWQAITPPGNVNNAASVYAQEIAH